jgi:uncharacterized 2Fe-2S/4Fe-4S cluster protein (DUF4445 family)
MEPELAMKKVRVTFYPNNEAVEAERGKSLLEIAKEAGIFIASICGGDGICGRCRVIIKGGEVEAAPTTLLTREEIQRGYALACQTKVLGDVEVLIPPESRAEGAQILIDEDAQRFRALYAASEEETLFRHDPLVKKLYLELPQPTLQDNLADQERLFREIRRYIPAPQPIQMGLKVLQSLPRILRGSGWKVTVTLGRRGGTTEVIQVEPGDRAGQNYGLAVDVGTSTVVAHLVDLSTSRTIDAEACYNSQMPFGEEVTRRIIYAEREGLKPLNEAIIGDINNLISALILRNRAELSDVTALCCAGNTTMLHFLLGLDPTRIRKSPYIPAAAAPPPVRAAEVGIKINPRGLLYVMPIIGSWVGGDTTAGILATGLYQTKRLTMFIDIGTNGEIVLGNRDWLLTCSTSAGPAFEGSGVKCGMKASRGAIERIELSPDGYLRYKTIGDTKPKGLCGSGLIDAVAGLFAAGYIDRSGRLLPDSSPRIRERDGQLEFLLVPAGRTETGREIVITQPDIENLLRAKAAIFAGAKILLKSMGLEFKDIEQLLIAGGFGNYLDREKAIMIGLIPDIPLERIRFVGNTSIIGAKMALLSEEAYARAHEISKSVTYYDLITYPYYYDEFISAKFLPHTDLGLFPTVAKRLGLEARV